MHSALRDICTRHHIYETNVQKTWEIRKMVEKYDFCIYLAILLLRGAREIYQQQVLVVL